MPGQEGHTGAVVGEAEELDGWTVSQGSGGWVGLIFEHPAHGAPEEGRLDLVSDGLDGQTVAGDGPPVDANQQLGQTFRFLGGKYTDGPGQPMALRPDTLGEIPPCDPTPADLLLSGTPEQTDLTLYKDAARNFGAKQGRGGILSFCDADDLWLPAKLAETGRAIRTGADACFGRIVFFDGDTGRTQSTVPHEDVTVPMLLAENPVCTMSNLSVVRHAFLSTGGFDTGVVHNEDLEWLIRLVGTGASLRGIDNLQVGYRTSPSGLSSDLAAMRAGRAAAVATAQCEEALRT